MFKKTYRWFELLIQVIRSAWRFGASGPSVFGAHGKLPYKTMPRLRCADFVEGVRRLRDACAPLQANYARQREAQRSRVRASVQMAQARVSAPQQARACGLICNSAGTCVCRPQAWAFHVAQETRLWAEGRCAC